MNIQALAAQAGFIVDSDSQKYQQQCIQSTHSLCDEPLIKFATLIAAHEREECAKAAEDKRNYFETDYGIDVAVDIADAIRARSKA